MAISRIGAGASDNWELITSVTPTASSATVNLTSIPSRRKLMLVLKNVQTNASSNVSIRVNNDSGTDSYFLGKAITGGNSFDSSFGEFRLNSTLVTGFSSYLTLSSCDNAGLKIVDAGGSISDVIGFMQGLYFGSAVVTELNVLTTSTFKALGTVAVYGVR